VTVLRLADSWAWDFWLAHDETASYSGHHLFYLKASRALQDPALRHLRASIGHAVSTDLVTWTELPDTLVHGDPGTFDATATWTGSIVRAPNAEWYLFYTGLSLRNGAGVQQIGVARSPDLITWQRHGDGPVVVADPRWYETLGDGWPGEHWRDPWVFADPDGDGWHMLITARSKDGPADDRGVIGHARSADLLRWDVQPPLSPPGAGFGQLEVPQIATIGEHQMLVFSCRPAELAASRRLDTPDAGTWALPVGRSTGPYLTSEAFPLTGQRLYAGKIVHPTPDTSALLAFEDETDDRPFDGAITDPIPIRWDQGSPRPYLPAGSAPTHGVTPSPGLPTTIDRGRP
jgi:beta-fructofuranosidase